MTTEYHNEYNLTRYYTLRTYYIDLMGGICAQCKSDSSLEFDHIVEEDKEYDISQIITYPENFVLAELNKCQLLCKSCHSKKTYSKREVDHGGGKTGKRNCKCDLCRAKRNEYMREYKRLWRLGLHKV